MAWIKKNPNYPITMRSRDLNGSPTRVSSTATNAGSPSLSEHNPEDLIRTWKSILKTMTDLSSPAVVMKAAADAIAIDSYHLKEVWFSNKNNHRLGDAEM